MSVGLLIRRAGHFIEQPVFVEKAGKWALGIGGASLVGMGAADIYKAKPEDRTKVIKRDLLVLGATGLGTLLGTKYLMMEGKNALFKGKRTFTTTDDIRIAGLRVKAGLGKAKIEEFDDFYTHLSEEAFKKMRFNVNYSDDLTALMKKIPNEGGEKLSKEEFAKLFAGMQAQNPNKVSFMEDLNKILPIDAPETMGFKKDVIQSLKDMAAFFEVGAVSVLSGIGGGLIANKVNKESNDNAVNMVKEGIFQFVANIALCAIGAGTALTLLQTKLLKNVFEKIPGGVGKLARTAFICLGLSVGIFGGGKAANFVGEKYVNPFFDKMQGKDPSKSSGKRKIEFMDVILHLDDLPTALALAGFKLMSPFIPIFFAFSGYRAGIGYRNDGSGGHGHHGRKPGEVVQKPAMPLSGGMTLQHRNHSAFQSLAQQTHLGVVQQQPQPQQIPQVVA